jgi:cytoskeleton protein RodZ
MSSALQHFEKKCIDSQNKVGGLFFEKRQSKKLSLEEVSATLNIRKVFLSAIENDNFDLLPGGVYNIGFIKNYAKFLDIDFDLILQKIMSEERKQEEEQKENYFNVSKEFRPEKNVNPLYVAISVVFMIIFALASYFYNDHNSAKDSSDNEANTLNSEAEKEKKDFFTNSEALNTESDNQDKQAL